ncbi:MAG: hypothetical protein ACK4OM_06905 [Alphaproteobacteria bacterium]
MNNQEILNLVTDIYLWFNKISDPKNSFVEQDLNKYFTSDFIMQLNDKIICSGQESLYQHFEEFRKGGAILKVQIPFEEIIISEDQKKCIVRYNINIENLSSEVIKQIKVIAIWHISNNQKLQRMNEVVHYG